MLTGMSPLCIGGSIARSLPRVISPASAGAVQPQRAPAHRNRAATPSVMRIASRAPVIAFATLAFAISWAIWSPLVVGSCTNWRAPSWLLYDAGVLGPAIAAFLCGVAGAPAPPRLLVRRLLRWKVPLAWYAVAIFLPFAVRGLAIAATTTLQDTPGTLLLRPDDVAVQPHRRERTPRVSIPYLHQHRRLRLGASFDNRYLGAVRYNDHQHPACRPSLAAWQVGARIDRYCVTSRRGATGASPKASSAWPP